MVQYSRFLKDFQHSTTTSGSFISQKDMLKLSYTTAFSSQRTVNRDVSNECQNLPIFPHSIRKNRSHYRPMLQRAVGLMLVEILSCAMPQQLNVFLKGQRRGKWEFVLRVRSKVVSQ